MKIPKGGGGGGKLIARVRIVILVGWAAKLQKIDKGNNLDILHKKIDRVKPDFSITELQLEDDLGAIGQSVYVHEVVVPVNECKALFSKLKNRKGAEGCQLKVDKMRQSTEEMEEKFNAHFQYVGEVTSS